MITAIIVTDSRKTRLKKQRETVKESILTTNGERGPGLRVQRWLMMIDTSQGKKVSQQQAIEQHRQRLIATFQPQTRREQFILDEMAKLYHAKEEFDDDHKLWMDQNLAYAPYAFRRQEADDFIKLKRQWTKAPAVIAPLIGESISGAILILELWQIIVARLAPANIGPVPGMDQACQALLALGFSDKIQNLAEAGWWWAVRFLAIQSNTDEAIKAWLRRSGTCDRTTEMQQARHKLYDAPDAAIARKELYDEATRQAAHWAAQLKQLQLAEPAKRQAQLAQARCMALKTPGLAACMNNANRLREWHLKEIKYSEESFARARKDHHEDERYYKRMKDLEKKMPAFFPPDPEPDTDIVFATASATPATAPIDLGQVVEAAIHADLLPKMAASQNKPNQEKSYAAHPPQPAHRPMSNRKKRLAKMAAMEKAKSATLQTIG